MENVFETIEVIDMTEEVVDEGVKAGINWANVGMGFGIGVGATLLFNRFAKPVLNRLVSKKSVDVDNDNVIDADFQVRD